MNKKKSKYFKRSQSTNTTPSIEEISERVVRSLRYRKGLMMPDGRKVTREAVANVFWVWADCILEKDGRGQLEAHLKTPFDRMWALVAEDLRDCESMTASVAGVQ